MNRELVKTRDNSHTLYVPELDEHYHSIHGALQESLHVFIQSGLHFFSNRRKVIRILEVGLGTGLNALLSLREARDKNLQISYTALEKYPLTYNDVKQLNYTELIKDEDVTDHFRKIHESDWEVENSITPYFYLIKRKTDLKKFKADSEFDLIYFDAFAPSAQSDLWTVEIFKSMHQSLSPSGLLLTYCSKGSVRRAMEEAGLKVEKIPGPPGKREMVRAFKPAV